MTTLILATRNRHKAGEIAGILGRGYRLLTLQDFPEAPEAKEDQPTFAGNAMKKAKELARWTQTVAGFDYRAPGPNVLVVADDSGLEVDALKGAPGVHSARFAALDAGTATTGNSSDEANNAKLLRLLRDVPPEKRAARFRCALASIRVRPAQVVVSGQTFEGVCEGRIQLTATGKGGFGYDSLFAPTGRATSFAQLDPYTKNQISHRAQAVHKFKRYLQTLGL